MQSRSRCLVHRGFGAVDRSRAHLALRRPRVVRAGHACRLAPRRAARAHLEHDGRGSCRSPRRRPGCWRRWSPAASAWRRPVASSTSSAERIHRRRGSHSVRGVAGERLSLQMFWDPDVQTAFEQLPGAAANELKLDAWIVDQLDAFIAMHRVEVTPAAAGALAEMARRAPRRTARGRGLTGDHSRTHRESQRGSAASSRRSSGSPSVTRSRRAALPRPTSRASARPSRRWPRSRPTRRSRRVVICPASMKLTWSREAARWLPHRSQQVSRAARRCRRAGRHHDPQLRDRQGRRQGSWPAGREPWWPMSPTTARTRRPSARRRYGGSPRRCRATGCGSRSRERR